MEPRTTTSRQSASPPIAMATARPWHAQDPAEVLRALETTTEGLTTAEAERRLAAHGKNRLPEPERKGPLARFLRHFHDLLIYILLGAGLVAAILGHWIDTGVILGVVVINAIIGFIQEGKAEQALAGIRKMLSSRAHVRRDGHWSDLDAELLVPGDLARLRPGDRVPGDLRLIEAVNLRVEESALTGESVSAEKSIAPVVLEAGLGDRKCMAYSGTLVVAGHGLGVVTATGPSTELGRINRLIADVETLATPLTRQMNRFGKQLSVVILGLAALLFVIGLTLHDYTTSELFLAAIGFAVAAIPEGLPAILTITLALGVQRMARRNAITRRLNAVETLGSVTVICSDKTGTLTKNEMTARHVVTRSSRFDVEGTGYEPTGLVTVVGPSGAASPAILAEHGDLEALVEVMAVANDSEVREEGGRWVITGEPTEAALKTLALKAGFEASEHRRLAIVPFESANKYMATLEERPDGTRAILVKGAPDRLLARASTQRLADGSVEPLDRAFWEAEVDALSRQGLRVLAAASREVGTDQDSLGAHDLEGGLTLLGLVGIIDPPRPEAIEAIASCRSAGIQVKMITGDHAGTALAIGREMGLANSAKAVTGVELEAADDAALERLVRERDVFARTSPEHKLRIVEALQRNGEVVAMTGDGVNDAPALKRADVGIAMGIKGTEATREAAEIVLADDNFQSIERAVGEGRTIYDNLRKAILFVLPTNGAEGLTILIAVTFGLVLPLTPVQILWVNMVTAVTLALALAFEPAEPSIMKRRPRDPKAQILDGLFLWRIAFVSSLVAGATLGIFWFEASQGSSIEVARTVAVNALVFSQAFYLFNSRFIHQSSLSLEHLFTNKVVWIAVAVLVFLQIAFVHTPLLQGWFGSTDLDLFQWTKGFGIGAAVFLLVELEKATLRRIRKAERGGVERSGAQATRGK